MNVGEIFNLVFLGPIINLLVFIIRVLEASSVPGSLGLSIIILTVLIRLLVWPLMAKPMQSAKKMAELKPHLDELKRKHKDDKAALAKAQMDLYKEHGVNPAGGCIPILIQFPVLIALYQTIFAFVGGGAQLDRINNLLYFPSWKLSTPPDLNFFGINLGAKPSDFSSLGWALLLIPVMTGVLQLLQSRMMVPTPPKEYPTDSPKEIKEKESTEDAMVAVQSQMTYLMPVMIGYFAFQFPIGLALYWNTLTILGIVQQYLVSGWGGLSSWIKLLQKK